MSRTSARAAVRKADWGRVEEVRRRLETTGHPDLAHLLQGEAYLSAGAYADAVAEFNQIKDQGEIRRQAAARTGRCLLLVGKRHEAERALRFAVEDGLDDVEAYRDLAVIVPELVSTRWYHYLLHNQTATVIKAYLLFSGFRRVVVINVPWYLAK